MNYVYGPVPSRRLGRSLGVDTIPPKTCNFSCVYCQLGRTTTFINTRRDFFPKQDILQEIKQRIRLVGIENIDYVTFVGEGEPTLCKSLGWLIERVKAEFPTPVAVITNGALLYEEEVREELCDADVVLPTLDAGFKETFRRINRPHPSINFQNMIEGMIQFRKICSGQLWIEYMVVQDLNDSESELLQLRKFFGEIKPDRIYVNVPIRPPTEDWVKIPSQERLSRIKKILSEVFEIILPEIGEFRVLSEDISSLKNELVQIIKRHPMRLEQIVDLLKKENIDEPSVIISELERVGLIKEVKYEKKIFYVVSKSKMSR